MWERYRTRPVLGATFNRAVWQATWQARIQKRLPWRSAQSMSPVGIGAPHTPKVKAWFDQPDPSLLDQWKHHPELRRRFGWGVAWLWGDGRVLRLDVVGGFPTFVPSMKPFWSDRIDYLRRFLARDGLWMMASQGTVKVLGFVAVVLVTRTASETEYGWYAYAMGLVATAVPFMGFGAYQAFVRFSVLTAHAEERVELHRRATGWGLTGAVGLAIILTVASPWICADVPESASVMRLLAWVTVSTFWMEHVKGLARALRDNKTSAQVDVTFAALDGPRGRGGGAPWWHPRVRLGGGVEPILGGLAVWDETGRPAHVVGSVV